VKLQRSLESFSSQQPSVGARVKLQSSLLSVVVRASFFSQLQRVEVRVKLQISLL